MFRVCMRPQAIIDLSKIAHKHKPNGDLGYNKFDITIYATNEESENLMDFIGSELVYITMRFA